MNGIDRMQEQIHSLEAQLTEACGLLHDCLDDGLSDGMEKQVREFLVLDDPDALLAEGK